MATKPLAVVAMIGGLSLPLIAHADQAIPYCDAPADLVRFANPLPRVAHKLALGQPITIVALGSSSTSGVGASSPAATYPSRLAADLTERFHGHRIIMINRGVGGEEVADMLKRFDEAVVAEKPDLVLWQLGTNSVIHDEKIDDHGASIREGLSKVRAIGADVVLIDPQFAPKVIIKADAPRMVSLIAETAKLENVDLFRRFEIMRRWHDVDHMTFDTFVSPDGLHMNDWSYACIAKSLGAAISEAATRPVTAAAVSTTPAQFP